MKKVTIRLLASATDKSETNVKNVLAHGWSTELLARASGVSVSYIRRLLRHKKLRGIRINRDWLIAREDGDNWLKSRGIEVQ